MGASVKRRHPMRNFLQSVLAVFLAGILTAVVVHFMNLK